MADALENELGVRAELVEGDDGVFDVAVSGEIVFSKQEAGDFIATEDIVALVRERV